MAAEYTASKPCPACPYVARGKGASQELANRDAQAALTIHIRLKHDAD